jgi:hypothetical protein
MSKLFKRIGTQAQKFRFEITIAAISAKLTIPVSIKVTWKMRNKILET